MKSVNILGFIFLSISILSQIAQADQKQSAIVLVVSTIETTFVEQTCSDEGDCLNVFQSRFLVHEVLDGKYKDSEIVLPIYTRYEKAPDSASEGKKLLEVGFDKKQKQYWLQNLEPFQPE